MAIVHDTLEAVLEDAGWLAGEFHHLRLPSGGEAFGFGVRGAAPWVEAHEKNGRFILVLKARADSAAIGKSFADAEDLLAALERWHARLPEDKKALLGSTAPCV